MSIENKLTAGVVDAIKALYGQEVDSKQVQLQKTRKEYEGNLTVALEVELTDELKNEGMARELINRIQNIRKESGLEITDRIVVTLAPNTEVEKSLGSFADYIKTQVLADDIKVAANDGQEVEFDEFKLNIKVEKK